MMLLDSDIMKCNFVAFYCRNLCATVMSGENRKQDTNLEHHARRGPEDVNDRPESDVSPQAVRPVLARQVGAPSAREHLDVEVQCVV